MSLAVEVAGTPPRVSVVMAVFNGEAHVNAAIESILGQTFEDFEFIIVDDGSTDGTAGMLRDRADRDERVVLLANPQNRGLIASLNRGIAAARGGLIARMDADDLSEPARLSRQIAYLDEHPDVGLLGTAYARVHADGKRTSHYPPCDHTEIRWRLLFGSIWPHPAVMFRRELLAPGETCYGDYLHAEDYELWTRLARRTRCATLPEVLLTVATHDTSGISARHRGEQTDMVRTISAAELRALWSGPGTHAADPDGLDRVAGVPPVAAISLEDASTVLATFQRFADEPDIDAAVLRRVQRAWCRSVVLHATRTGRVMPLLGCVFLRRLVRSDPAAFLPSATR